MFTIIHVSCNASKTNKHAKLLVRLLVHNSVKLTVDLLVLLWLTQSACGTVVPVVATLLVSSVMQAFFAAAITVACT
jgi:hypothetical protein